MDELEALVTEVGGIEGLAAYLGLPRDVIETALSAPEGAWTDRVSRMVAENTTKLVTMPSQGGFFWRLTRKRVVKDWLLLSRWSDATGAAPAERYRAAASLLDRHVYENVLSIAFAPDATPAGRALAESDPDGFVATYLAECDHAGVSVQEISDHFDEVRQFAEEHADEIAEAAERMRNTGES